VERRQLGTSDLAVSRIGLGTWAIGGGDWILGWGPQKDADSIATIRRAVDLGINWIDTAAVYGLGHSEIVVGRALRDIPPDQRPYVLTTSSLVWDELGNVTHSLQPHSIRREAEASLRRLNVDCIDLYQLGWPVWPKSPPGHDPGSLEDAWQTMATLQREGKARCIGIANCAAEQLSRLHEIAPVTSLQAPYSLLQRGIEDRALAFCASHAIGVIANSPMRSGLLTGKMTPDRVNALPHNDWRQRHHRFQQPNLMSALQLVERVRAIGERYGRTPGEVAIAWALHHPAVTAAIVGARQPHQVDEIVGATSVALTAHDIDELERASTARAEDQRP
jgi:aryl-alcohol dehydrogenase-like predicted oxidoreductase